MNFLYPLFASTVFLSSFLLFQVQPLMGKHILPWYGGSSAVWVTAMFFFMVALAVGYIYALLLSKLRPLYQAGIHTLIVVGTLGSLYTHSLVWPSAITPQASDVAISFTDPVLAVFSVLILTVGLPFALLASTSSLLQLWYAALSGKEPFSLYGISNIGSLLGLLSYPLIFEPFFTTYTQGLAWSVGMGVYAVLLGIITVMFYRTAKAVPVQTVVKSIGVESTPSNRTFFLWLCIAAVPVMVLLAGTSFMTVAIAPIPFLWVGPLALYLLSFIFTFREGIRTPLWFNELFVVAAALSTLLLVVLTRSGVLLTMVVTHVALFAISHWCHEYLYKIRPQAKHLTLFYVALSLGGIVGSVVIKISNSYLLTMPIELMLILVGSVLLIAWRWVNAKEILLPGISKAAERRIAILVSVVVIACSIYSVYEKQKNVVAQERNFFGYKAVLNLEYKERPILAMQHGLTNHGYQAFENGVPLILPVSYYGPTSGIGKAFSYLRQQDEGKSILVAGLGSGGLAAYCRPYDKFIFMEIDAQVVTLAKEHFTYLESCPQYELIVADARLSMEEKVVKGEVGKYDLIILDAYADDMMPMHLMTTEAIAVYKKLLNENGILAVHISSRYLRLLPVLAALATDNNLDGRHWFDKDPEGGLYTPSQWVLLSKNEAVFTGEMFSEMEKFGPETTPILWTDTYSALLPIIRFK